MLLSDSTQTPARTVTLSLEEMKTLYCQGFFKGKKLVRIDVGQKNELKSNSNTSC